MRGLITTECLALLPLKEVSQKQLLGNDWNIYVLPVYVYTLKVVILAQKEILSTCFTSQTRIDVHVILRNVANLMCFSCNNQLETCAIWWFAPTGQFRTQLSKGE